MPELSLKKSSKLLIPHNNKKTFFKSQFKFWFFEKNNLKNNCFIKISGAFGTLTCLQMHR